MKISLEKLQSMHGALSKILTAPIDFKVAYRIRKISGKLIEEIKHIESARMDLIKKYGEKADDKGNLKVPEKKYKAFEKEFLAFLKTEIEISGEKIPLECMAGVKISAVELSQIECLIEDTPKPKTK